MVRGNTQITLKAEDLKTLSYQAAVQDRIPILHILLAGKPYVLLQEADYSDLTEQAQVALGDQ